MLFYRYRDMIPYNRQFFLVALFTSLMLLAIAPHGDGFVAVPITYVTVYLGLMNPPRHRFALSGDYSYGLFLYGYPIQQAIASVPMLQYWYLNFAISLPLAAVAAVGSWWLIEKPSLSLRKYITRVESFRMARATSGG